MLAGNHWQLSGIPSGRTNFNSGHVEPYLSHATPSHVPAQIAPPAWVSRHTIPSGFLAASYFAYCVMSSDQKGDGRGADRAASAVEKDEGDGQEGGQRRVEDLGR